MVYRNDDPNDPNDQANFHEWLKAQEIQQSPEEDVKDEEESTPFSEFMEAFLGG